MEVDENEETFLEDSEDTGHNDDDEAETKENSSGLLSYSLATCKDN